MFKEKIAQYRQIRKMFELPLKLNLFFSMLENTLTQNSKNLPFFSNKKFDQPIAQIFTKAYEEEKAAYLLEMISFIKSQYQREDSVIKQKDQNEKSQSTVQQIINTIQTSAQMQQTYMKVPYWYEVRFKFNKIQRYIDINSKKRNFRIFLKQYLVRKSHNFDSCIVFQAVKDEINDSMKIMHFCFQKDIFGQLWDELFKCVVKCRNQQLLEMMKEESGNLQNWGEEKCSQGKKQRLKQTTKDKTLVFLSGKSVKNFQKYKDTIINRLLIGKFDFKSLVQEQLLNHPFIKTYKIQRSQRAQNLFRLQVVITKNHQEVKKQFSQAYRNRFKYILMTRVLQEREKYQAVYERFLIKNKVQEIISIRQFQVGQKENVLFSKGVEHIISSEYIEFLMVRVRKLNEVESKLIVITSFSLQNEINIDVIIGYMLQFKDMLYRAPRKQTEDFQDLSEDEFFTICSQLSYQDIQLEQGESRSFQSLHQNQNLQNLQKPIENIDQKIDRKQDNKKKSKKKQQKTILCYLSTAHQLKSKEKTTLFMKQHYLFKDWVRVKAGGVACHNEVIIGQQKKLFKKVITKMGSNLLKGNGIINVSLPVDIFKKESQLTSIARDFCYAPIFLEKGIKSNSELQRIKYATLQAISVGNLGISMEKPFNPILGQTMQAWIDNCPIYLQQISHHPPISAYLMQGRGYTIDGQVESKISLGMNTAKGYSQRPNHINFADGTKMTMLYGKMLIKGMLFGERQFTFQDKIFVYDETNNLFSQILYGPRKRSMMGGKKQPQDFISGKIYEVSPSFKAKFYKNNQNYYPMTDDILQQLSSFEGIWTQSIKFDGKQYINFKTQLPYDLINEQYPLLSNSWYRLDLAKLVENKIQQAQKYKQLMQEAQRKDRKLREKYRVGQN